MGFIKKLNKKKIIDIIVCICILFLFKINVYISMLVFDGYIVCFRSIIMYYK